MPRQGLQWLFTHRYHSFYELVLVYILMLCCVVHCLMVQLCMCLFLLSGIAVGSVAGAAVLAVLLVGIAILIVFILIRQKDKVEEVPGKQGNDTKQGINA